MRCPSPAAWEDGIPNLDPKEMREAEEKRRAEEAANKTAGERDARIWGFVLSTLASSVQKNGDGGYDWVMGSIKKKLGIDRAASFTAFWNLDSSLRDDLVDNGVKLEKEKMASAPVRCRHRLSGGARRPSGDAQRPRDDRRHRQS